MNRIRGGMFRIRSHRPEVSFVLGSARMVCDPRRIAAVAWQGARCLQQSASIDDVHVVENRHAGDLRRGVPEFRNRRNAILRCHLAHFNCVLTEAAMAG